MEHQELSKSPEAVDDEAKRLVAEHLSLVALRDNAKEQLYASSTLEDRKITGQIYGQVAQLNRDHNAAASEFAHDNVSILTNQAAAEATADGHTINLYEAPIEPDETVNLENMITSLIRQRNEGDPIDESIENRLNFAYKYCLDNDIDPTHIGMKELFIIRSQPEWQNAE